MTAKFASSVMRYVRQTCRLLAKPEASSAARTFLIVYLRHATNVVSASSFRLQHCSRCVPASSSSSSGITSKCLSACCCRKLLASSATSRMLWSTSLAVTQATQDPRSLSYSSRIRHQAPPHLDLNFVCAVALSRRPHSAPSSQPSPLHGAVRIVNQASAFHHGAYQQHPRRTVFRIKSPSVCSLSKLCSRTTTPLSRVSAPRRLQHLLQRAPSWRDICASPPLSFCPPALAASALAASAVAPATPDTPAPPCGCTVPPPAPAAHWIPTGRSAGGSTTRAPAAASRVVTARTPRCASWPQALRCAASSTSAGSSATPRR